jgi:hypothetical protein
MRIKRLDTKGAESQLVATHGIALATTFLRSSIFGSFWL